MTERRGLQATAAIMGLGYLGVRGEDLDAWHRFATEILGMECTERTFDVARFRVDARVSRLTVEQGPPGLAYIGWEVQDARALDQAAAAIEAAGTSVTLLGEEDARHRGVLGLACCTDPAGTALELFYGAPVREVAAFASPRGARFVTGDQGFGHIVVATSAYAETVDFYTSTLGFGTTDVMAGPVNVSFLGCNRRHHSLAVVDSHGAEPSFHHFMVEVESLRTVGQAYDRVLDQGLPVTMTLGQHWNDEMTSFYVESPSGFSVELGWGGRTIDRATWTTVRGTGEVSYWGHRTPNP